MASHSADEPVRWMRKGTRACQECRRRKIKCNYANEITSTCHECSENGRICTRQGVPAASKVIGGVTKPGRLKLRVTRLESVVERISRNLAQQPTKPLSDHEQKGSSSISTRDVIDHFEHELKSVPPLYALFRNEVLSATHELSLPMPISHSISFLSTQISPQERLLSTISNEYEILSVLQISSAWWPPFQHRYSGLKVAYLNYALQDFVSNNLASDKPVSIALALLCIATSLQTLRPGIDDQALYLSCPATELMNKITTAVDQTVLNNDDDISCLEGVVLLLMRGKHHAESNQLRKAWLGIRRAVLVAQKTGRPVDDMHGSWEKLVNGILEVDRFFSMFLGMPYAADSRFEDCASGEALLLGGDIDTRMRNLRRITAIAAGKINDRNAGPKEVALDRTREIQQTLDTVVSALPIEWWKPSTHTFNIVDPLATYEHLNAQFWFFQTQSFLQLPYMLQATSNPEFLSLRETCLNASRSLVKIWILLRTNTTMETYLCRLDDFQGLIGAIIILVGLLQCLDVPQDSIQFDLDLLEEVKRVFRYAQKEQNGAIARQGLRVLDTLGSFLRSEDYEQHQNKEKATLFVPYFGAIAIEVGLLNLSQRSFEKSEDGKENLAFDSEGSDLNNSSTSPNSSDFFASEGYRGQGEQILTHDVPSTFSLDEQYPQNNEMDYFYNHDGLDGPAHETLFNWEGIMLGTELNQDWDEQFVDLG